MAETGEGKDSPVRAAVLVPVFERDGELYLVFIERSSNVPMHSGQVAFPGGVHRTNDGSLLDTALREAEEEIGLSPDHVVVTAELPEVPTMTSGFLIAPFVGSIARDYPFRLDPREVASIFFAKVSDLRDPGCRRIMRRTLSDGTEREVPTFVVGERIVWGATETITCQILERV